MIQFTARQGDVLILPADVPDGAAPVPTTGARAILAYGEATGHHHSLPAASSTVLMFGDRRFVKIAGEPQHDGRDRALSYNASVAALWVPEMVSSRDVDDLKRATADVVALAERDGFVALQHLGSDGRQADHLPIIFPPGYTGEVKVPREYAPDEIRAVED